jgi:hypothetical protein
MVLLLKTPKHISKIQKRGEREGESETANILPSIDELRGMLTRRVGEHLAGAQADDVVHIGDGDGRLCGIGGDHDLCLVFTRRLEGQELLLVWDV